MLKKVLEVGIIIIVLGAVLGGATGFWHQIASSGTSVAAITDTGVATTTFQMLWPISLLVIGIGISVGVIMFALRSFHIIGGK